MRRNGKLLRSFSSLVALYRNGAQASTKEAAEKLKRKREGVVTQVNEMHDSGLLRIAAYQKGEMGRPYRVYEWAEPFGAPDVKQPARATK